MGHPKGDPLPCTGRAVVRVRAGFWLDGCNPGVETSCEMESLFMRGTGLGRLQVSGRASQNVVVRGGGQG